MEIIPYGKQNITDDDILEVVSCLKSDYLTQGPMVEKFENSFSNYVDSKYAIAVSNGTAALHLSVLAPGRLLSYYWCLYKCKEFLVMHLSTPLFA